MTGGPVSAESRPSEADSGELGRTSGATLLSGGLWNSLAALIPVVQTLAISVSAARFLGPDDLGRQSFIAFVSLSIALVANTGMPAGLTRFSAELFGGRKGGVARTLFAWTWRIQLAWAVIALVAMSLAAALGAEPQGAWILAGGSAAVAMMQTAPASLLQGAQRWRQALIAGLCTTVASVPLTIGVLAAGGGITGYFAAEVLVAAVGLVWTAILGRRLTVELPPREPMSPGLKRSLFSFVGVSTMFGLIELVVWRRSEFIFLERYSTDAEIALYSIAFAATAGLARIPGIITRLTLPAVATMMGAGEDERIRSGFWRGTRLLTAVSPLLVAIAAALGPSLIRLAYGSAYAAAGSVLVILVLPFAVLPLMTTSDALLWAFGRLRFLAVVGVLATIVNIGLDILLIPAYDAVGAALANVGAQLFAGVPSLVLAARLTGPVTISVRAVAGTALAAAAGGGLAWAPTELIGGVAGVAVGLVAGTAAMWVVATRVGILAADDARWAAALFGERLGGVPAAVCRRVGMRERPVSGT